MAKKLLVYFAGVVTGAVLTILCAVLFAGDDAGKSGITMLDETGECVPGEAFKIMQVLDNGNALAVETDTRYYARMGTTVLFLGDKKSPYYDEQIIHVPDGKCARMIGTFKYESNSGLDMTVPIVDMRDK